MTRIGQRTFSRRGSRGVRASLLASDPDLARGFAQAFESSPQPITLHNVTVALASYERRLLAPSRVDRHLQGEEGQLDAAEQRGRDSFRSNCARCHDGPGIGGTRMFKLGLEKPWPAERSLDRGRFAVTGEQDDAMVFVVPSLRNVGRTAPYLHDGSVTRLEEVIRLMGEYQIGTSFDDAEVADLVAFLRALDSTPEAELLAPAARGSAHP